MEKEKIDDYRQHLEELLSDPEFRACWEADEVEFQVRLAIVQSRADLGMTQQQLAQATGMNQRAISRIESGRANPTVRTLERIARGFGKRLKIEFV